MDPKLQTALVAFVVVDCIVVAIVVAAVGASRR
jgi:hypothetical protein